MSAHDSAPATREHIARVRELLGHVIASLRTRAEVHDRSKLEEPEKALFDRMTPRLAEAAYGSPEYADALRELRPALDHHYAENSHHPEHYPDGVDGMTLLDLIEMLVDWKAAGERDGGTGDLAESIRRNVERFNLSPQLTSILQNTAQALEGR